MLPMVPEFLARFWRNFDCVDENFVRSRVYEDPDELGYRLLRDGGSVSPSLFDKPVATEETMTILCEIAPPEVWWEIEEAALTEHLTDEGII